MGKYVNEDSKGNYIGTSYQEKINNLIADGAIQVTGNEYVPNMICVVNNGLFAAAAYADTEKEWNYFRTEGRGNRPETWLVHPLASEIAK